MRRAFAFSLSVFSSAIIMAGDSFAADAAHGDHAEKAGGLPQMDPTWFASQLFWLVIIFAVLYVIFSRNVLPNLSATLESRREHIQRDLDTAQDLRDEAETVFRDYETTLEEARNKASDLYQEIDTDIRTKAAKEYEDFQERLVKETKIAETKINKAKQDAMADMNTIVAEVAKDAAEKIVGVSTDMDIAKNVVNDLAKKPKAA